MRISFDVSEDKELREAVRALIREQVVSVIRETIGSELQAIVKKKQAEFDRAIQNRIADLDDRLKQVILEAVRAELVPKAGVRLVERLAREEISKAAQSYLPPKK